MKTEEKLPAQIGYGAMVGGLMFVVLFILIAWILWQLPLPVKLYEFEAHLKYWVALRLNEVLPPLFQSMADYYRNYLSHLEINTAVLLWRFNAAFLIAFAIGGYLGLELSRPRSAIRHIAGRQFYKGRVAVRRITKFANSECKKYLKGIALHPTFAWSISIARETRHFLLLGSSGSGKTQIATPLLRAAVNRGDRVIIYDIKGDFTQWLPQVILIAPCDERSFAWDIARDCRNHQAAIELAAQLIPSGHDPMWHQAARQILTAMLIKLQRDKGVAWGWQELSNLTASNQQTILAIVQKYLPSAIHTVSAPGKTTQSILINFGAHMGLIHDLAKAWGHLPTNRRFSFIAWLKSENARSKTIVLQGNGHYEELTKAYIQGIMAMATGFINSPEFPDGNRRIWFFLDEFPQLGDLRRALPLLEVGRSKGVRLVLSAQDIHQIKEIYGEHVAATLMSLIGTKIITQQHAGPTANYIAKEIIGNRKIDRVVLHKGVPQAPIREDVLLVEPSELESELGRKACGIAAIVLGFKDAYQLTWPLTKISKNDRIRQPFVPAAWLNPTTKRASPKQRPRTTASTSASFPLASNPINKLVLKPLTKEQILAMAETGTSTTEAADPFPDMTVDAIGRQA